MIDYLILSYSNTKNSLEIVVAIYMYTYILITPLRFNLVYSNPSILKLIYTQ